MTDTNITLELIGEAIWTLLEPKIDQKLTAFREENDIGSIDLDDKISDWMSTCFRLEDYSYDLDGMIDQQVQYLAEHGDLKEWLEDYDNDFNERVFKALGEIDMKFGNMTVTYKDAIIVKE
jgi:hypothetical protein